MRAPAYIRLDIVSAETRLRSLRIELQRALHSPIEGRNAAIIVDHLRGMSRYDLADKHGCTYSVVGNVIHAHKMAEQTKRLREIVDRHAPQATT